MSASDTALKNASFTTGFPSEVEGVGVLRCCSNVQSPTGVTIFSFIWKSRVVVGVVELFDFALL